MPIEGCPDYATKDELQELRDQLNEALGTKEDGGTVKLFEKNAGNTLIAGGLGLTLFGMAKTNAPKVITDIVMQTPGTQSIWKELSKGTAKLIGFKGNGAKVPISALGQVGKTAGTGAAGAKIATGAATTAAAAMSVLMSLVNIAASLGLNIATVNVMSGRIDAEAKGVRVQLDAMQASMISLYEKNQGDIAAVQAEIDANEVRVQENRNVLTAVETGIQQANDERLTLFSQIANANTAIQELQSRNQQLRDELNEANIDIAEINTNLQTHIDDVDAKLTEAADIVAKQQTTIQQLTLRIESLETVVEDLGWMYGRLDAKFVLLRFEFSQLRQDLIGDPDLNEAKAKLKSAQLILLDAKAKTVNLGGGSGAAAAGTAESQKGLLQLANNMAGEPINVPDITAQNVNERDDTFRNTLADLLPQINPGSMTPEQIEDLRNGISLDFKDQLGLAIPVGAIDAIARIDNQTSLDAISTGVQKGLCNSLNGGGCTIPPGNPPTIQGLGGMNQALSNKMDALNAFLNGTANAQNTQILNVVKNTNDVVNHTTFGLKKIQEYADIAWKATHADKAMTMISTVLAIHNGMMLSNNLAQTIGEATSMGLQALGIKDSQGNPFDINTLVRAKFTSLLQDILGKEQYTALTQRLAKSNRIYQSAVNTLDVTKNLFDSAHTIAEITAANTGQIGNALRDSGAVAENAYGEMLEKVNPQNAAQRKLQNFRNGIDNIEQVVSSVAQVSGEVVEVRDNFTQLKQEKKTLLDEIETTKTEKAVEREQTKADSSLKTDINQADFDRAPSE